MSQCAHAATEFDYHDGYEVCLGCGMVLEQMLFYPDAPYPSTIANIVSFGNVGEPCNEDVRWVRQNSLVRDLCERFHLTELDAENITSMSLVFEDNLRRRDKNRKSRKFNAATRRCLIAAAIYVKLVENKNIMCLSHVTHLCEAGNVGKKVWNILKSEGYSFGFKPLDFLPYFCRQLDLSSKESFVMEKNLGNLTQSWNDDIPPHDDNSSFSPQNTCLALLYLALNSGGGGGMGFDKSKFKMVKSLNQFAKHFHASPVSLRKIVKLYQPRSIIPGNNQESLSCEPTSATAAPPPPPPT